MGLVGTSRWKNPESADRYNHTEANWEVPLLKRAAINALFIVALAAITAWLVFTPDPPRHCSYSSVLNSCTWTKEPDE